MDRKLFEEKRHAALLRKAAESQLASAPAKKPPARPPEELLHELQVHQIELEMQNEELRRAYTALEESRDRYVDLYEFAPVGYLTLTSEGLISEINLTGVALLGAERKKLLNRRFASFVAPECRDHWHRHFLHTLQHGEKQSCEIALVRADGTAFQATLDCLYTVAGASPLVRIALADVTERKQAEDQIHKLAFYDALTQQPNRLLLNDRLIQSMAASKRSGLYNALLFLDFDNFKPLNDKYGHDVGDLLLIEGVRRINLCIREMDTLARFGGDEFVIVLCDLGEDKDEAATQARIVAEKIRTVLAEPYVLKIRLPGDVETIIEHRCTVSIGVMLFINHQASTADIIKWADIAMYQAKEAGGNRVMFYSAKT